MRSVLTINSGSSSLRFALFNVSESLPQILIGKFDRIGLPDAKLTFTDVLANQSHDRMVDAPDHVACVPLLVELLVAMRLARLPPCVEPPPSLFVPSCEQQIGREAGLK